MKTSKRLLQIFLTLNFLAQSEMLLASSSTCENPTLAEKPLCDDIQRAEKALRDKDYAVAQALLASLKEKIRTQDPLARDIERLEGKLSSSQAQSPTRQTIVPKANETPKGRYRSDGWRKRTSSEIFSLYGVAVGHGIYSGFFGTTFKQDNSGPASFGVGGLLGLVGSVGAVYFLDFGEGMRYGVPSGIESFYSAGIASMSFTALFVDGVRRDHNSRSSRLEGYDYIRYIWYGGTGGAILGGLLAQNNHLRPGQSIFISSAGNWAGLLGMGIASSAREGRWISTAVGGSALGANLFGLAAASVAVYGYDYAPSGSTVQMINLAGSAGVLMAGLASMAIRDKDTGRKGLAGMLSAGGALGLGLGWFLTRNWEPDRVPMHSSSHAESESSELRPWTERVQFALAPTQGGLGANISLGW